MNAPEGTWRLINQVREAGYDWLTLAEKQRLHDLVVRLKTKRTISADDIQWLERADENLKGATSLSATFSWHRRGKGGMR
jgi:hypothetical protein